ncbi:diaminopimelate epimerase [Nocardioides dubius]|uniref:Diaminopimelate epimerase n=1 Tax=Nocardioides dubius TaxID=317019 RepID=A0ABN1TSC7_9ACTN
MSAPVTHSYPFAIGHGTENDFVLLPDHDGAIHGDLSPQRVAALCERRAGLGGDGVIRVIRTAALGFDQPAEWFMDYRNADGSIAEMCGNGVRVFGRYLADEGLVSTTEPVPVGTRDGVKVITFDADGELTVDMGTPKILGDSVVGVDDQKWPALNVDMGNPHAVAFVDDLLDAGSLLSEPDYDRSVYPDGVNIEFVARRGPGHVAFRVHERGSGETRSCGTGACAVLVAAALDDGVVAPPDEPVRYEVDVPGGRLQLTWLPDGHVLLGGPAVIVGRGTTDL